MGYAGICGTNVQPNSDAHFNYVNVRDISANIKPGGTSTCAAVTVTTNNPPTADAGNDYIIPKSTAFILEGTATDADGMSSLTYEWSQNDPAQAPSTSSPQSTWTVGPLYRAKMPIASPNRYMPTLPDVIAGNLTPQWEVTPSVGRVMNFSFMVRDNEINGAQTADDLMKVTVNGASGPFVVTSQTSAVTLNEGTNETITWNVANTTAAPVSTPNVDIFLSLDGGLTYPITLASGVPNNGSASVLIPSGAATTTARVMVRGAGNIFYALNSSNFSIIASEFVMVFGPTANTSDVCSPGTATYNFTYNTFLGFNQTTTFSATGNPAGTTVSFSPATAQANGTPVTVTVNGLTAAMVGNYSITVTGTAPAPLVVKNTPITLNVYSSAFNAITLSSPANGATGAVAPFNFSWVADANATAYDIDIATDGGFSTIVENSTGLTNPNYTATTLTSSTTYFWRVKPSNQCGAGSFSSVSTFTTGNCNNYASTNVPVAISASGTPTITSTLNVTTAGTINDVDVVDLVGTHTWINDLTVTLTSPQNTTITLWDGICDSENDFDVNFDDAAAAGALPCPPVGGGNYQPQTVLSAFNGENASGTWTLTIADGANQDGGSLNGWGLNICTTPIATGIDQNELGNAISIYPNPTNNLINVDLNNIDQIENVMLVDVQGKIIYQNRAIDQAKFAIDLSNNSRGIYILKVQYKTAVKAYKVIKQ
jgi:subtilisin-like proprotein convertase family protein